MLFVKGNKAMKCKQYYPVIMTDDVAGTSKFYQDHFRFRPTFESDWYIHLQSSENEKVNVAILQGDHETVPEQARGRVSGLILNFETDDVDAEYALAQAANLPIVLPIRDEEFGQRHFMTVDPNGVLIDVIKEIPPTAEFAAQFTADALPV